MWVEQNIPLHNTSTYVRKNVFTGQKYTLLVLLLSYFRFDDASLLWWVCKARIQLLNWKNIFFTSFGNKTNALDLTCVFYVTFNATETEIYKGKKFFPKRIIRPKKCWFCLFFAKGKTRHYLSLRKKYECLFFLTDS